MPIRKKTSRDDSAASRLHVGVDARSLLCREPRGEGKSLQRLYEEIERLDSRVALTFFGDERGVGFDRQVPRSAQVRLLSSRGARLNAWEDVRLPLAAWWAGCDVLHCTSSSAPWRTATATVLTVHDLIPMLAIDGQSDSDAVAFKRRLQRSLSNARHVIAVSAHTRADPAAAFPAQAAKVVAIPWGRPPAAPTAPVAHPGKPYVLAFGGTAPRKNTGYTLERFAAVAARLAPARLVIVGVSSAAQSTELIARAAELGLSEQVQIAGFVDEDALQSLLHQAALVLYLSRYEGFGLPLLEAVAHGVPVVASDSSSIPEVLGDREACFALTAPARIEDAIVRVMTDATYRRARIDAQRAAMARFDWMATAARTLQLLRDAGRRP